MSAHYSKFSLNTYYPTPYFQACLPPGYPLEATLTKARAFRRLPPNLRALAANAKAWADRVYARPPEAPDIKLWYDNDGYELNPETGERLTDEEIDADWGEPDPDDEFEVEDIPVPKGGFPDPETWEEPPIEEDEEEWQGWMTEEQLLKDIKSHGREYVARYHGIPPEQLADLSSNEELAGVIYGNMRPKKKLTA